MPEGLLLLLSETAVAKRFLQIEAADKLLLMTEFEALEVEQIPSGIDCNKRPAEEIERKVGSVVDTRLIARVALIGKHAIGRIKRHHVAAEIGFVP